MSRALHGCPQELSAHATWGAGNACLTGRMAHALRHWPLTR
ncbi:hypothetical protein [Ephemeroptericola cinctiostellae]|nr:hypothetical protein [Ephemeroptericola cinctiostellae]